MYIDPLTISVNTFGMPQMLLMQMRPRSALIAQVPLVSRSTGKDEAF